MFTHIFSYRLKCLLRDKSNIFWTMVFPLLLATFFYLAFSNLVNVGSFEPVNVAVADNAAWQKNEAFRQALLEVSDGEDRLFNLTLASAEEAEKLLLENKIAGYIMVDDPITMVVNDSGMPQSIIKSFIDNYMQLASAFQTILTREPSRLPQIVGSLGNRQTYVRHANAPAGKPNNIVYYFYTLIAMSCFYGGFMGLREISDIQANISATAARVNAAPVHKMKAFLFNFSASLLIHLVEMLILLFYIILVLRVDFGGRIGHILLTTFVGSVAGLSFGAFISVLVKKSSGVKVAVLICVSMVCSFLAGMMNPGIKYEISRKVPFLSWINPVNLLSEAFYCLYYYDTMKRYILNMAALSGFIILFCSVTYCIIRRRKYASL